MALGPYLHTEYLTYFIRKLPVLQRGPTYTYKFAALALGEHEIFGQLLVIIPFPPRLSEIFEIYMYMLHRLTFQGLYFD